MKLTYVFISHNLADVKSMCDSLAVMYLAKSWKPVKATRFSPGLYTPIPSFVGRRFRH